MKLINPFTRPGTWYRANLHTHTTISDGQWPPEKVSAHYRRNGYQILFLTDHNRTNDVTPLCGRNFLVMNGAEFDIRRADGPDTHHLVALGIPRSYRQGASVRDADALIRSVRASGGEVVLAHPYWSRRRYEQYSRIKGFTAMEVYNHGSDEIGRADSETHWSQLLDEGWLVPAVAVDDAHAYPGHACGGWVWFKLRCLSPARVMDALRRGCYYSSTGPRIHDFRVKNGRIILRCTPAVAIHLILHHPFGGATYRARPGASPFTSLDVPLQADWQVFRAVVVDSRGRRAWTNPLVLGKSSQSEFLKAMKASWARPYRACGRMKADGWKRLDLSVAANRSIWGRDAWFGDGGELAQIKPGLHRIHGVPFFILNQKRANDKVVVAVCHQPPPAASGRPVAREAIIPVGRRCRGVYLLQAAGYVQEHGVIGRYDFEYADGTVRTQEVVGHGRLADTTAGRKKQQKLSTVQDWWPACPQFDGARCRSVFVADPGNLKDYRVLYTLEWRNPRPEKSLKQIRMSAAPGTSSILVVLAATAAVA